MVITRFVFLAAVLAICAADASAREIRVPAGGNLQAALDAARAGDTILLEAGATYVGNFRLPKHAGPGVITVRSATADRLLPPPGTRITPAHAPLLPKIRSGNTGAALSTAPGAAGWRLVCLEFQANERGRNDIITLGDGSEAQRSLDQVPRDIRLERVYVHGDPLHGQKRGVALNSADTAIVDSHIAEMKAIGQDSQAVGGWNGPGPFLLENNHLEAAGEVFMLGGSDPSIPDLVPSDVVLRGNRLTRPLRWRDPIVPAPTGVRALAAGAGRVRAGRLTYRIVAQRPAYDTVAVSVASDDVTLTLDAPGAVRLTWAAVPDATEYRVYRRAGETEEFWTVRATSFTDDGTQPGTAGTPPRHGTVWEVKNILELKNARRVRIERNLLEHNWAQAQSGVAVLFTTRNQNGRCRWCIVEDVVFEFNTVRGVGDGINILGRDDEKPSAQGHGFVIRHNRFLDIGSKWGGTGYFVYIQGEPRDVTIDHNTFVSADGAGIITVDGPPVAGFRFTNNLAVHLNYGVIGTNHAPGLSSIKRFFPDAVFSRNVIAGGDPSQYPPGNEFPTRVEFDRAFVDVREGNVTLTPQSKWSRGAADGGPLGARVP